MKNDSRRIEPANDPSFDPVLALILRFSPFVALSGMVVALVAIGWALSL